MSQKVVVIGGGYAGIEAAKGLDAGFDVTLIAGGEAFRHLVYGLRASVLPDEVQRMLPPYDNLLKRGIVLKCKASKINAEESTVTVSTGELLPYDFLVLATGILHPKTAGVANNTTTVAAQIAVFKEAKAEMDSAQDILVIGGGPIGIEMAGEIREEMPEKSVTLVTSKELMPSENVAFPQKFRTRLRSKLEKIGVTVHTDCGRVKFNEEDVNARGFVTGRKTYSWSGGEIEADLCIVCTGAMEPASLYEESGLQAWLDEKGQIKVKDTLEVKEAPGSGKVFAAGDCVDLDIPKIIHAASTEGATVAKQIKASAAGKPLMKNAKPMVIPLSVVPVGKSGGVSTFPLGVVAGDFVTRTIKSKHMFAAKAYGLVNAGKPPAV